MGSEPPTFGLDAHVEKLDDELVRPKAIASVPTISDNRGSSVSDFILAAILYHQGTMSDADNSFTRLATAFNFNLSFIASCQGMF